jgi:hypothetical protein
MKTTLIVAAALGLSIFSAAADCPGHMKKDVLASKDTQTTTASVTNSSAATTTEALPVVVQNDEETKAE